MQIEISKLLDSMPYDTATNPREGLLSALPTREIFTGGIAIGQQLDYGKGRRLVSSYALVITIRYLPRQIT
jgi:hypothetical protein